MRNTQLLEQLGQVNAALTGNRVLDTLILKVHGICREGREAGGFKGDLAIGRDLSGDLSGITLVIHVDHIDRSILVQLHTGNLQLQLHSRAIGLPLLTGSGLDGDIPLEQLLCAAVTQRGDIVLHRSLSRRRRSRDVQGAELRNVHSGDLSTIDRDGILRKGTGAEPLLQLHQLGVIRPAQVSQHILPGIRGHIRPHTPNGQRGLLADSLIILLEHTVVGMDHDILACIAAIAIRCLRHHGLSGACTPQFRRCLHRSVGIHHVAIDGHIFICDIIEADGGIIGSVNYRGHKAQYQNKAQDK